MRTENSPRPTRLLRVREFAEQVSKKPKQSAKSGKSRFVAPYYFKDAEQQAVLDLLERSGIGDDEGRRLFLTAAEYEIGTHRPALSEEQAAQAQLPAKAVRRRDEDLARIGAAASQLAGLLADGPEASLKALTEALTANDPFARGHDTRYLGRVLEELRRIGEACHQPPQEPEKPAVCETGRRLIQQIARIYGECLEVRMEAQALDTFAQVLCLVRDAAEIRLPCERDLIEVLLKEPAAK